MKPVDILLIDDNEGDVVLTMEALKEGRIRNNVAVAMDGQEALTLLQNSTSLPDLILLDINLPKINGLEVLATIKKDQRLKIIPVIMLSTSARQDDIMRSYENYASFFITKPVDYNSFIEVVRKIEDFWITIVRPHTT